jgi:hypothetical protein
MACSQQLAAAIMLHPGLSMNERWQIRLNWVECVVRAIVVLVISPWVVWYVLWTTAGTDKGLKFYFCKLKGWVVEPLGRVGAVAP